jgi:hypothetical protein
VINLKDWRASTLTACPCSSLDPLTGSSGAAPLPRLQTDDETTWWRDHAVGTVSSDGAISLYLIGSVNRTYRPNLNVAIQRPGRVSWTVVQGDLSIYSDRRCCIAYHDGRDLCVRRMEVHQGDASRRRRWC